MTKETVEWQIKRPNDKKYFKWQMTDTLTMTLTMSSARRTFDVDMTETDVRHDKMALSRLVTAWQDWLCDWRCDCRMLISIDCRQNQRKRGVGWIPLIPFHSMIMGLIISPASSPYNPLNNNNNNNNIMDLVKERITEAKK